MMIKYRYIAQSTQQFKLAASTHRNKEVNKRWLAKNQPFPSAERLSRRRNLKAAIAELKSEPGALMPVMQKAQEIYGYLPIEVQTMISDEMGIPLEKVYGVCHILCPICPAAQGQIQNFRLSWHCLLCKGLRRYFQEAGGDSWHHQRRVYPGREILSGFLPLCRRLRTGPRYDDQRRGLRTTYPRRRARHPGQV